MSGDDWRGELAVTGLGLVTPVGLSAPAALAALRAGVSRLERVPGLTIRSGENEWTEPIGARVPVVTGERLGPERLRRMMDPALAEALADAEIDPGERIGVYVGTSGSSPAGRVLNYDGAVRDNLLESLPDGYAIERAKVIQAGRAAVLKAVRAAAAALEANDVDVALIGAVDSWVTPRALAWLRQQGMLPEYPRHTGTMPGESAGFIVLESPARAAARGVRIYASITASAGRNESTRWGEASQAKALGQVIRVVADGVSASHAVVVSDLNGERYRALEWSTAETRSMWSYRTSDHWHAADCIGDPGAAAGAVSLAWAAMALHRGHAGADEILAWGASDEGPREAALLRAAGEAA